MEEVHLPVPIPVQRRKALDIEPTRLLENAERPQSIVESEPGSTEERVNEESEKQQQTQAQTKAKKPEKRRRWRMRKEEITTNNDETKHTWMVMKANLPCNFRDPSSLLDPRVFVNVLPELQGHEYESLMISPRRYLLLGFKEQAEAEVEAEARGEETGALSPEGKRRWIAMHLTIVYEAMELSYQVVKTYHRKEYSGTTLGFPAGCKYEKREDALPASEDFKVYNGSDYAKYVKAVLKIIFKQEQDFPDSSTNPFPEDFEERVAKRMTMLVFRVYAMIFTRCYSEVKRYEYSEAQIESCFKHFYFFARRFDLFDIDEIESHLSRRGTVFSTKLEKAEKQYAEHKAVEKDLEGVHLLQRFV